MTHPLVTQLWFARSEFMRCLEGVSAEEGIRRIYPMNCISWMIGHLASQENFLWVKLAQGKAMAPELTGLVGLGRPASTPPMDDMWAVWHEITRAADAYLNTLTPDMMAFLLRKQINNAGEDVGTSLLRNTYHYWFHLGEAHAVRQLLGHHNLPQFVGNMSKVHHSANTSIPSQGAGAGLGGF